MRYYLDRQGRFVIEGYERAKPFASFFPGIAGPWGIPMWVFYVNRGQGVVSLGTKDKNSAIAEFLPADRAWELASVQGFRTFLKIRREKGKGTLYYEPFQDGPENRRFKVRRRMKISSYELEIEEINRDLGIKSEVRYWTLPNEPVAALAREAAWTNLGSQGIDIEVVDGLPKVVPYGTGDFFLKKMSRTIQAWMQTQILPPGGSGCRAGQGKGRIAFYNLSVDPRDRPETLFIDGGNFYFAFLRRDGSSRRRGGERRTQLLDLIVDPQFLFGGGDLSYPRSFVSAAKFRARMEAQGRESRMPCAMSYAGFYLRPGQGQVVSSLLGYSRNKEWLLPCVDKILNDGFLARKREENQGIIRAIEDNLDTRSALREFNLYARQTFLDNVLRGGYPLSLDTAAGKKAFYVYSRKHGDLERDYNEFCLNPTYFSQGNGNYRDINQNRRSDNWFNADIGADNIVTFLNLIQSDGFNPLVVKGVKFVLDDKGREGLGEFVLDKQGRDRLGRFLKGAWDPGGLAEFMGENGIEPSIKMEEFLARAVSLSRVVEDAEHSEGFWTDHWTYNLDLLEEYLAIYPEGLKEIFLGRKVFSFFDNPYVVRPRAEKYRLVAGRARQYDALKKHKRKEALIAGRREEPYKSRRDFGQGGVLYTDLFNKLFCLLLNKLASLDACGCGVEMEANKPNWFDSLNGLPALFGSSVNETFELKRLIVFLAGGLRRALPVGCARVRLLKELALFMRGLAGALEAYFAAGPGDGRRDFVFWDKACSLKEGYRGETALGFSGDEEELAADLVFGFLDAARRKVELGLVRARDKQSGLYHSYFINEVVDYELLAKEAASGFGDGEDSGRQGQGVRVLEFHCRPLPLFLEGQVHCLRLEKDRGRAAELYQAVKRSPLYDRRLKMFKVCAGLKSAPAEIGRCRVFAPGWLENESVWLHMEYKFLLELLRCGLHREFYREFFNCLIPFLDPARYGRSILENSSFLVSSVFPDEKMWGNGFVARLSGSTAEFIHIWRIINAGVRPFVLDGGQGLVLRLRPILHRRLFDKKTKTYGFRFLGRINVIYRNPRMGHTFGEKGVSPRRHILRQGGKEVARIDGPSIPEPYSLRIRVREIDEIEVEF